MKINKQLFVLVTAGMVLVTHTAVAEKQAVTGAGANSCGKFIAEDDWLMRTFFFTWAQGYLTGFKCSYSAPSMHSCTRVDLN